MAENIQIQGASLEQRQQQQLSLRQRQALELLHLPALELEERLTHELEANPLLEELPPENPPETALENTTPTPDNDSLGDEAELDEKLVEDNDDWADELPLPDEEVSTGDDLVFDRVASSAAPDFSLSEELHHELATCRVSPRLAELAGAIIDSLDASGYLRTPTADLAMAFDADEAEVAAALRLVQSFDPPGVGARDLAEALRLQLERSGRLTPLLERLLAEGLDDLARNRLPALARRLGVSVAELNSAIAELRSLNPLPGERLSEETGSEAVPEIEIVRRGDDFVVRSLREHRRRIGFSERYLRLLENDAELSGEDRAYLRDKYQRARELMRALEQRGTTLERLGGVIVATQREFLEHGVASLKPLTMKQAGAMIGVHETTISRAAADKYVATPQGIFPFRFFFSAGYEHAGESGDAVSNRVVMERIRELIAAEDSTHPLSDERVSELLKAENFPVARRTVAKYRELMKIPPSSLRRRHE